MDVELDSRIASVENSETMKLNTYLEVTTDAELNLPLVRFHQYGTAKSGHFR